MRPLLCHLSYAALVIRSTSCRQGFYHGSPSVPGIVPENLRNQEARDAACGGTGLGGSWRSTARHRSAAGAGFISTGAANRMRKVAYRGVYPRLMRKITGGAIRQDSFSSSYKVGPLSSGIMRSASTRS